MSRTELYIAYDNTFEECEEFRNSHGGAMFIWNRLIEKFEIPGPFSEYAGQKNRYSNLWQFCRDNPDKFLPWEWNALQSTYDNVVVMREHMLVVADSLYKFAEEYDTGVYACNLRGQSKAIRNHYEGGAKAITWNQTSVNCNPWEDYDEENDEYTPYDFTCENPRHWVLEAKAIE